MTDVHMQVLLTLRVKIAAEALFQFQSFITVMFTANYKSTPLLLEMSGKCQAQRSSGNFDPNIPTPVNSKNTWNDNLAAIFEAKWKPPLITGG